MDSKHLPLASFKRLTCFFFQLRWVFVAARGLSLVAGHGLIEAAPLAVEHGL